MARANFSGSPEPTPETTVVTDCGGIGSPFSSYSTPIMTLYPSGPPSKTIPSASATTSCTEAGAVSKSRALIWDNGSSGWNTRRSKSCSCSSLHSWEIEAEQDLSRRRSNTDNAASVLSWATRRCGGTNVAARDSLLTSTMCWATAASSRISAIFSIVSAGLRNARPRSASLSKPASAASPARPALEMEVRVAAVSSIRERTVPAARRNASELAESSDVTSIIPP